MSKQYDLLLRLLVIGDSGVGKTCLLCRDTAGQERFDTITKQYYRRAHGVLIVYDISNADSFRHIEKWLTYLKQHTSGKCDVTLVGNKTDLDEWRQVPVNTALTVAEKHGFAFHETSAYMEPANLEEIFEDLVKRILVNQTEELSHQTIDAYLGSESDDDENVAARYATADKKCCSA